jgi:hypothetical protein
MAHTKWVKCLSQSATSWWDLRLAQVLEVKIRCGEEVALIKRLHEVPLI